MYQVFNLTNNPNVRILDQKNQFTLIEHIQDLSAVPDHAAQAWYASQMNIRKRQVICNTTQGSIVTQAGSMLFTVGEVQANSGIKGVSDLLGKAIRSKLTNETAVKPEYQGNGLVVLEPTYKYLVVIDVGEWGGGVVLEDGLFLCADASLRHTMTARSTVSSAMLGDEGLFNLTLNGQGIAIVESPCPREEIVEIILKDDVLKVDGSHAIAWSPTLKLTVERSTRSIAGSVVSQEGLVNVYRGTGKVWLSTL